MKKSSKRLILLGMTTSLIATSGIMQGIKPLKGNISDKKLLRYDYNPTTALDNIFIEDGMTILPFIYTKADQTMTKDKIEEEFRKAGLTIKNISTGNKIGTGTEITVNENSNTYTVLIYGDVDGDGEVGFYDALDIISAVNNPETKKFEGIFFKAANLENTDDEVEFYDALRIIAFVNETEGAKILKVEPESLKEKDVIASVELETAPTKNKYNYGETTLDLTGGKIKVNWQSGNVTYVNIDETMIKPYDISTEGPHEIIVTYNGQEMNFEITVLDKISALELTATGRKDVNVVTGGYQTESNKEFVLGTIQAVDKENVSAVTTEMLQIEIPAENQDVVTIEKVVDADGNITLKGKVLKDGIYNITALISYEDKEVKLPITLQVIKNKIVKEIKLNIEKDDLRVGTPLRIGIEVINQNDEKIDTTITCENVPNGINWSTIDADGNPVTTDVKFIEISTTLQSAQSASFIVKATGEGTNNAKTATINVQIKDAPVVSRIELSESIIPLYIEEKDNTVYDENGNIYTVLDVKFFDQTGELMNIPASSLLEFNEHSYNPDNLNMTKDDIALIRPTLTLQRLNSTTTVQGNGLYTKFYDEDGNEATGNTNVSKIGVAIITDSSNFTVDLASIVGKNLKFVNNTGKVLGQEIPLQMVYKDLENIRLSEDGSENVTKNQEGNYVVQLNQEFVLGTITVGANEGPLTADMLTTEEIKEGLNISYELNQSGQIIVKGTATQAGKYTVRPMAGLIKSKNSMIVEAISIPEVTGLELSKETVEIGRATESELIVTTTENPSGEVIEAGDIELQYNTDAITVTLLDADRDPIGADEKLKKVKYLKIEAKTTTQTDSDEDISITLYKGKENETKTPIVKTIAVYQPIPRSIEVDSTVTVYGSANAETIAADGLNYTLVPIKAWADAEHKKPVVVTYDMFSQMSDDVQFTVTIPKVDIIMNGTTRQYQVIQNKFFDENKVAATSGDITYIGFAKRTLPGSATLDESTLNGLQITITCAEGETKTITTSYVAGN